MAEASTDILMTITGAKGPIRTDSRVTFASRLQSNDLSQGFVAGFIFELREFGFSAGAASSLAEGKEAAKPGAADASGRDAGLGRYVPLVGTKVPLDAPEGTRRPVFSAKALRSDVPDMQPIDFTRLMDSASAQLCDALTNCQTLRSITVIKRKAAGTLNGGEAYLRFDFTSVLLTELEWKETNDVVEESGRFIYRSVKISYRPQSADGKLGNAVTANWAMKA